MEFLRNLLCCCGSKPPKKESDTKNAEQRVQQIPSTNTTLPPSRPSVQPRPKTPPRPQKIIYIPPIHLENQQIKITVITIHPTTHEISVASKLTILELKTYIFNEITNSLEVDQMSLSYQGTVLRNTLKLSEINIVTGNQLKIKQNKLSIGQIRSIIADVHGIDPISQEVGVARMACGHHIGRDTMTQLVRSLISSNKYEIRCPYPDENDHMCGALWDFKTCKKIGVFTAEETQQFEEGLSINWMKENSKYCPRCSKPICKYGLKTKRVVCSNCKYGDFCYMCLGKWNGSGSESCGNQMCSVLKQYLSTCPWNRKFNVKDRTTGVRSDYMTPQYRACPSCNVVFEHLKDCKHMKCPFCGCNFCWICLGTPKSGRWDCGAFNDYCGKVAQAQRL